MVIHSQTILRQQSTNCLSVFDHFVGLTLKVLFKLKQSKKISAYFNTFSCFIVFLIFLIFVLSIKILLIFV